MTMKKFNVFYWLSIVIYGIVFFALQMCRIHYNPNAQLLILLAGIFTLYCMVLAFLRGYLKSRNSEDKSYLFRHIILAVIFLLAYFKQASAVHHFYNIMYG